VSVEVRWYGDRGKARIGAIKGLQLATEMLLEYANRTVPIEEGTLQRSGTASVDDEKLEGGVSYDTKYAVKQHEDTRLRHDPGRRAKWLELSLNEINGELKVVIADSIKKELGM